MWKHRGLEGNWSQKNPDGTLVDEWCHAGGCRNWEKIGIGASHDNYGLPCVIGWLYWEDGTVTLCKNCIFCGRRYDNLYP